MAEENTGIQKRGRWDCPKHLTIPYSDLKNNLNPTNQLQYPRLLTLRTNHTNQNNNFQNPENHITNNQQKPTEKTQATTLSTRKYKNNITP